LKRLKNPSRRKDGSLHWLVHLRVTAEEELDGAARVRADGVAGILAEGDATLRVHLPAVRAARIVVTTDELGRPGARRVDDVDLREVDRLTRGRGRDLEAAAHDLPKDARERRVQGDREVRILR
jgi:hypothetical protein